MADPYRGYPAERDPRAAFPGYVSVENPGLASHGFYGNSELHRAASDHLQRDAIGNPARSVVGGFPGANISAFTPLEDPARSVVGGFPGANISAFTPLEDPARSLVGGFPGANIRAFTPLEDPARSVLGGFPGANIRAFTPLEDPALVRQNTALDVKPSSTVVESSTVLRKDEGLTKAWPGILFVDGLPNDCTKREAAHLFRPFIGFKDIKVLHKEPRRSGDKARVLCFVEFTDANCASTAMEALQGYKFDDTKLDAPVLRIQFAQFPFHPPARD